MRNAREGKKPVEDNDVKSLAMTLSKMTVKEINDIKRQLKSEHQLAIRGSGVKQQLIERVAASALAQARLIEKGAQSPRQAAANPTPVKGPEIPLPVVTQQAPPETAAPPEQKQESPPIEQPAAPPAETAAPKRSLREAARSGPKEEKTPTEREVKIQKLVDAGKGFEVNLNDYADWELDEAVKEMEEGPKRRTPEEIGREKERYKAGKISEDEFYDFAGLSAKQKHVMKERTLNQETGEMRTLEDIGTDMEFHSKTNPKGVGRERIRQIERDARKIVGEMESAHKSRQESEAQTGLKRQESQEGRGEATVGADKEGEEPRESLAVIDQRSKMRENLERQVDSLVDKFKKEKEAAGGKLNERREAYWTGRIEGANEQLDNFEYGGSGYIDEEPGEEVGETEEVRESSPKEKGGTTEQAKDKTAEPGEPKQPAKPVEQPAERVEKLKEPAKPEQPKEKPVQQSKKLADADNAELLDKIGGASRGDFGEEVARAANLVLDDPARSDKSADRAKNFREELQKIGKEEKESSEESAIPVDSKQGNSHVAKAKELKEKIESLFSGYKNGRPIPDTTAIEEELDNYFRKVKKADVIAAAKEFGVIRSVSSKEEAVDEIKRLVMEQKRFAERVGM